MIKADASSFNENDYSFYFDYSDPNDPETFIMLKDPQLVIGKLNNSNPFLPNFLFLQQNNIEGYFAQSVLKAMLEHKTDDTVMTERFLQLARLWSEDMLTPIQIEEFEETIEKEKKNADLILEYTKETFFHKLLNNLLRTADGPFELYYGQYFVREIFKQIQSIHKSYKTDKDASKLDFICYRGAKISKEEIDMFKNNEGKLVETLGFLSTSSKYDAILQFSPNVIIQIRVHNVERWESMDY